MQILDMEKGKDQGPKLIKGNGCKETLGLDWDIAQLKRGVKITEKSPLSGPGRTLRGSERLIFLGRYDKFYQINPPFILIYRPSLNYAFPKLYTLTIKNYLYFSKLFYIFSPVSLLLFMLVTLPRRLSRHFFLDF